MQKGVQNDGKPSSQASAVSHPSNWETVNKHGPIKLILVLGPRSCGKSSLIKMATSNLQQPSPPNDLRPTTDFFIYPICRIGDQTIRFIDSPGFGDPKEVPKTLLRLIDYLYEISFEALPRRLTGILYIHPESDDLGGQTLRRNLHILRLFIGEQYLERVTTLVRPQSKAGQPRDLEANLRNSIMASGSPFHSFYHGISEPRILVYKSDPQSIGEMMQPYSSMKPWRLYTQDKIIIGSWTIEDVPHYLQQGSNEDVGEQPGGSRQATPPPLPENTQEGDHEKSLEVRSEDKGEGATILQQGQDVDTSAQADSKQQAEESGEIASIDNIKQPESTYKEQIEELKIKLEKTQAEYASLRSHLQVQDNIEHGQITQTFDDINRLIEDFGQLVSDYLADECPQIISSIQALETPRLQKLLGMFGHREGRSSLVKSSGGEYPDLTDFLFYAIRAILCDQLYAELFKPFHPRIAGREYEQQNYFMIEVYRQITRQEPQAVAGRWRKDSFNSISRSFLTNQSTTRQRIADSLYALIGIFFKHAVDGRLTNEHEQALDKLIVMAEDWNRLVKGTVVFHGDFQPIVYPYCGEFRSSQMSEFGAKPNSTDYPKINLATIELGLIRYSALGGGQEPGAKVLRKAVIASEKLLFR